MFDAELCSALSTALGDIVTLDNDLGESPGLGQELSTRFVLLVLADRGLGIALGTVLDDILSLGNSFK